MFGLFFDLEGKIKLGALDELEKSAWGAWRRYPSKGGGPS